MAVKISIIRILALFFPYLVFVSSLNFSYPAVFNFGDSNSDTGGLVAGIAFPLGLPMGQTYFHESSGRFCDGRLIIDFLSNLSLHLISACLLWRYFIWLIDVCNLD